MNNTFNIKRKKEYRERFKQQFFIKTLTLISLFTAIAIDIV